MSENKDDSLSNPPLDDGLVPIASSATDTPSPNQSVKEKERDSRYIDISVVLRKIMPIAITNAP